jgi:hypothetical protein
MWAPYLAIMKKHDHVDEDLVGRICGRECGRLAKINESTFLFQVDGQNYAGSAYDAQ